MTIIAKSAPLYCLFEIISFSCSALLILLLSLGFFFIFFFGHFLTMKNNAEKSNKVSTTFKAAVTAGVGLVIIQYWMLARLIFQPSSAKVGPEDDLAIISENGWEQARELEMIAEQLEISSRNKQQYKHHAEMAREIASRYSRNPTTFKMSESDFLQFNTTYDIHHPLITSSKDHQGGHLLYFFPDHQVSNRIFRKTKHALVAYQPRTYVFPGFLNESFRMKIINECINDLHQSEVEQTAGAKSATSTDQSRTSRGTWMDDDGELSKQLKLKISAVTGFPTSAMETVQVLRYSKGQKYESHHDYFDPAQYGPMEYNRVATFYTFLSASPDLKGGEFALPMANNNPYPEDYSDCSVGFRAKPVPGNSILFYGMRPNGLFDVSSIHTGCTVTEGEKWSAVVWIRTNSACEQLIFVTLVISLHTQDTKNDANTCMHCSVDYGCGRKEDSH